MFLEISLQPILMFPFAGMGQWSELPRELLETIQGRLNSYVDKVQVRAVCRSWNSYLPKVRIPPPLLLLPSTHQLYNLVEKKFDFLNLPELQGKFFNSSFYGWVVATDNSPGETSPYIFLINPLTKDHIQLPPRYTFPDVKEYNVDNVGNEYTVQYTSRCYSVPSKFALNNLVGKVVLSSSPSGENCVVVAIYGALRSLAWCKCNDDIWTSLYEPTVQPCNVRRPATDDILFHQGRLYALNFNKILVFENIGGPDQRVMTQILPPLPYNYPMYLAESSKGELLVVNRYNDVDEEPSSKALCTEGFKVKKSYSCDSTYTEGFKVYKHDLTYSSWLEVKNLGDDMLFLGCNSCWTISSRKYSGCKGNRIYFAIPPWRITFHRSKRFYSDIGVFNMEDGSLELLPGFSSGSRIHCLPPVWICDADL